MKGHAKIGEILAGKLTGKPVRIRGWVHRARSSGGLAFVVMRDATGVLQCAIRKDAVAGKDWGDATSVFVESSAECEGVVREDKRAPGGFELGASAFSAIFVGEAFPIAKDQSVEFLLDTRHLWLRSQRLTNVLKGRDYITRYLRQFFFERDFFECTPPIITKSACEGGATLFSLDYFGEMAYLTQSGQMYGEVFSYSLEKIFILAPSFRAEPSRTIRHLAEYWHLEPEMAFYSQKMNMELQEEMVEFVCHKIAKEKPELLEAIGRDPRDLLAVKGPFPRIDYGKAIEKLQAEGLKIEYGQDLGADEEAELTKESKVPIFVHNHPKVFKAFYMREDPQKPGTVLSNDLLAPQGHGEIIGGSERIWDYGELMERVREQKLDVKEYQWYIDLRKYGSVPHAGFGLGIERLVKWMLNLEHIRDAIPFPRTINRAYP